jgi:CubicO group peptidase (beta-lactamase class C family)
MLPRILPLLAALAVPLAAASQSTPPPPLPELEAFMDSPIGVEIRDYGVPGLVVSVVRDGRVVSRRGTGWRTWMRGGRCPPGAR